MEQFDIYKLMSYKKDECYTTKCEADKLVEYLSQNNIINHSMTIWCPFDDELSNIAKALRGGGYKIVLSSLELGFDFYNYNPQRWDMIITNPPFSGRTQLMHRLISFNKPFIILQATQMFNNQFAVNDLCKYNNDFKFIMPRTRMSFLRYVKSENVIRNEKNGASFYSFWLCYKTQLQKTFNELKDSGKEKQIEKYTINGNAVVENQFNLFNYKNMEEM